MNASTKDLIRLSVACVLALSYPVLMYLSISEGVYLRPIDIGAYLFLVALFLREIESVADLVEVWRG